MKKSRSFEIALSALACAVMTGALTLGSYVGYFLAGGYLLAAFALMVPLAKDFYWGAALAHAGACLLAFAFGGGAIWTVLPFAVFFGLHPIVNRVQSRYVKKKVLHAAVFLGKAAWFDGALLLMWYTLGGVFGIESAKWYPVVSQYLFLVVFLGGTVVFAVYDFLMFFCQRGANQAVMRIGR